MDEREEKAEDQAGEATGCGCAVPAPGRRRWVWPAVGLVVLLLIAGVSVLALIPAPAAPPMPSFQFLSGQVPVSTVTERDVFDFLSRKSLCRYSFPGDFQSVCNAAHAELSALGYVEMKNPSGDAYRREYQLRTGLPDRLVIVQILDHSRLVVYSSPKNSEYPTPDRWELKWQEGWISVEIRHEYRGPWLSDNVARIGEGLLHKVGLRKTP